MVGKMPTRFHSGQMHARNLYFVNLRQLKFTEQEQSALEDYIEVALMIQYNH